MPERHFCDRIPCPECSPDEYLDSIPFADSLGYPAALGYDEPGADDPADFTGPDADVPALIAARSDHHAISDAAPRYLDDGDEYPYD